ncbi:MAG TPA: penicillin-binding transpeptidase domain-containing protein [Labilithrix sp.]|nr:penicillin-binding transpeptidase domain-containing protein [Labilithrix sp.]
MRRRPLVAVAVGVPLLIALAIPLARRSPRPETNGPSIAKLSGPAATAIAPPLPTLAGLDLVKLDVKDQGVTAPLPDKKIARLAIDPALQRVADGVMKMHHLPEAAVVVMDVETGKVIVYASHVEKGPKRDLAVEATAPAASVFKVVTGTSLVENADLGPEEKQCYSGGEQRLTMVDLVPDPKRDRWCTTLGGAMGRSINTVFARLALEHLKPAQLEETARSLGFGAPLPFDVPVQISGVRFPGDELGFARTAAGFWNTTLSPIHAAWLGAAIARGGEAVRPVLVTDIIDDGKVTWSAPTGLAQKRIMKSETAHAVTTMMDTTVSDGTSFRAFHDTKGRAFLPGVSVAGKTGTLTEPTSQRFYTWFTGFAPSKPVVFPADAQKDGHDPPQPRKVAFGVLVVNDPKWTIKANVLAREVLRAYFAGQHVAGVTAPHASERDRGADQAREGGAAATSTTPATKQRRQRGS